jgi:hypothetical protein
MKSPASPRLTINLIPSEQWGANLRKALKQKQWDILRKETYRRARSVCEVCGGFGKRHPVEAHEIWEFNDMTKVQRLVRLVALCPECHEVQHFGRAMQTGRSVEAAEHLMKVNGWDDSQTRAHINEAFNEFNRRNEIRWILDFSILADYGVEPPSPEDLADAVARKHAEVQLDRSERQP